MTMQLPLCGAAAAGVPGGLAQVGGRGDAGSARLCVCVNVWMICLLFSVTHTHG
jgi:hypothetical protein